MKTRNLLRGAFATLALSLIGSSSVMAQSPSNNTCETAEDCRRLDLSVDNGYHATCVNNTCELRVIEPCNTRQTVTCALGLILAPGATQAEIDAATEALVNSCDDGDPTTLDACQTGQCNHYPADPQESCNACTEDAECDDNNPDTLNWCDAGRCQAADQLTNACIEEDWWRWCYADRHCNDRDPGTLDWCEWGVCAHLRRKTRGDSCAPEPECVRDRDCRDGDRSTKNWCHEGTCRSVEKTDPNCLGTNLDCTRNRDCVDQIPAELNYVSWCTEGKCRVAGEYFETECVLGSSVAIRP